MTNIPDETDDVSLTQNESISTTNFTDNQRFRVCLYNIDKISNKTCELACQIDETFVPDCVTGTATFWMFVCFMCLGTIGFNVTNSATDATCFDILGKLIRDRVLIRSHKNRHFSTPAVTRVSQPHS